MSGTRKAEQSATIDAVLQLQKIGDSWGIALTKDILARFGWSEGDRFTAVMQPGGGMKLVPYDDIHARAMAIARESFETYADTFRKLAK